MTSVGTRARDIFWPASVCAVSGALVFQFLGNSTRGYIGSDSLFYWWGFQWVNPGSETQHGLLILGISAWLTARELRSHPAGAGSGTGSAPGAVWAMLGGLAIHVLGFVAEQARVSILGLLLFTWGTAAFAGGRRWARATAFPVAFMVFAIPFNALDSVGFWLRMWVVSASARLAHGLGIGVLVNGSQLLSPDGRYDYDVAAACSGVRSLMALAALSLLIGHLRFRSRWLWAAMLAASFPLIYAGNVARIASIVVAAQLGGRAWGDRAHEAMGFGVFAIVLGGILGTAGIIGRLWPAWLRRDPDPVGPSPFTTLPADARTPTLRRWSEAAAIASVSIAAAALLLHISRLPADGRTGIALAANARDPVDLPTFLGTDWIGQRSEVTEIEKQVLPPDTGYSRKIYISLADPSKQALLSIVLSGRDRTSIHRPELCLVGQGWTIRGSFTHRFSYPGKDGGFPATVLRVEKNVANARGRVPVSQLFAYYFVGGDDVVATHWDRISRDAWDRVARGRADRWAYVVIQTGSSDGESAALERIQTILDGTLRVFQKHG